MNQDEVELAYGVAIQMNMDQTVIQRSGYTVLDILSDVGGLQGILISGILYILSIVNHNHLNNFLVSKLFKSEAVSLTASQSEVTKEFFFSKCLP